MNIVPVREAADSVGRDYVDLALPKAYTSRVRNALVADPSSVNLRNLGGGGAAFYACGIKLNNLCVPSIPGYKLGAARSLHVQQIAVSLEPTSDTVGTHALTLRMQHRTEDASLLPTLHDSFRTRMVEIMDQSQHSLGTSMADGHAYDYCLTLDAWERERESCFPRTSDLPLLTGQNSICGWRRYS